MHSPPLTLRPVRSQISTAFQKESRSISQRITNKWYDNLYSINCYGWNTTNSSVCRIYAGGEILGQVIAVSIANGGNCVERMYQNCLSNHRYRSRFIARSFWHAHLRNRHRLRDLKKVGLQMRSVPATTDNTNGYHRRSSYYAPIFNSSTFDYAFPLS